LRRIAKSLLIDKDVPVIEEGTRNPTLFDLTMCILGYHYGTKEEIDLRDFLHLVNKKLCKIPLPAEEIDTILDSAFGYTKSNNNFIINRTKANKTNAEESNDIVEQISEEILKNNYFLTLEESKEILYYQNGVYIQGGEILIETEAEKLYGYEVKNKHITEIKGHIIRRTYHKRSELDSDPNIRNVQNGLYNIKKKELMIHDPKYLSIKQIPLIYDKKAQPKLFGKFLKDVLYPTEIRTAVETMGYTFYSDCPFEYFFILFGDGSNGKSVFTGLLTALHGTNNVSNVSISSLIDNKFALADLEFKDINIDSELSNRSITDTSILKKLTGGRKQPIRIERKNKDARDVYIYTKLFFNTNSVNDTIDQTTAFYRRLIIISFPNKFEGQNEDPFILDKLTEKEELSGIFNILMHALRNVLNNKGIHLNEKTIEERR
jgi:P4 family phage/plasmid primase-like protien